MTLPTFQALSLREENGVLALTIERPDSRNAMSLEMVNELRSAFDYAEGRADLRALFLRGAGGHFCAGADLKDLVRARALPITETHNPVAEVNAAFGHLCAAFAKLSLPTVVVLEGAVLGGGFGLACASDIALASETAMFGLPETSLGVVPAQIAPFLVERLGFSQAKRLALSGGKIGAAVALSVGLVHEVHAPGAALEAAIASVTARLLACAPQATRATKRLLLRTREQSAESLIGHASEVFAAALTGPEGSEGTLAFLQKRKPSWDPGRSGA